MADISILVQEKTFAPLVDKTADLLGFPDTPSMLQRLGELGVLETADWFLLRDLTTRLASVNEPEAAALLILLFQSLNRGSLCLGVENAELGHAFSALSATADNSVNAEKAARALTPVLRTAPDTGAPLVLDETNKLLYFQRLFVAETALKKILDEQLAQRALLQDPQLAGWLKETIRTVCEERVPVVGETKIKLNTEQKTAVAAGLLQRLVIITGGPGTGKTSLVAALLRALVREDMKPESIRLAAPTGRAAQRLSDAIGAAVEAVPGLKDEEEGKAVLSIESGTIHRLLSYNPRTGGFRHGRNNPLPYDMLVVDEASMISAGLMASLLEALPRSCRLVLIGDRDQLPSVEAGAVLSDLLPEKPEYSREFAALLQEAAGVDVPVSGSGRFRDRIVFLTESYRSVKDILGFAEDINRGKQGAGDRLTVITQTETGPEWPAFEGNDFRGGNCQRMDPPSGAAALHRVMRSWVEERMMGGSGKSWDTILGKIESMQLPDLVQGDEIRQAFDLLSGARILTCLRRGTLGCDSINNTLVSAMREKFDPRQEGPFFHGLPILITENDRTRNLFNGDIGLVMRCRARERSAYRVFIDRPGVPPVYTPDEIPAWEPAFAITVHKSQGSEYGEVLLVMPEEPEHNLNTREILYTGVTRGKRLAVIMGSTDVIDRAAATPNRRESGLKIWSREK